MVLQFLNGFNSEFWFGCVGNKLNQVLNLAALFSVFMLLYESDCVICRYYCSFLFFSFWFVGDCLR